MDLPPDAVRYNGAAGMTLATSDRSWRVTVDGQHVATLTVGIMPGQWRAASPDLTCVTSGNSPQTALDELAAMRRRKQHEESRHARLTTGQREARELCAWLRISPRTRRWRAADRVDDADTHALLLAAIEAVVDDGQTCVLAGAARTYREHIEPRDNLVSAHVRGLRPWRLAKLLATMADDGVTDAAGGATWLNDVLRPRL